jgi:hypothetical protein
MTTVLDTLNAMFDRSFPPITPPRTPDVWGRIAEADAKRAAYVAEQAPVLARIYAVTPARVEQAFDNVGCRLGASHMPLLSALLTRDDHAEIGRLLLAAIDARIQEVAEDAAEDASYAVIPEVAL